MSRQRSPPLSVVAAPNVIPASTKVPSISRLEFQLFRDLVYRLAGISLSEAKMSLVQNRLHRRLQATGCTSFRAYHELAAVHGSSEQQACLDALTTNETFFFRHKEHWDQFIGSIVGVWPAQRRLRIWSAASSTGEEAYSAAIACAEHLPLDGTASIEATDISHRVLEVARRGVYGAYALQKLTPYTIKTWFHRLPGEERWQVRDEAKSLVNFRSHNLLDPHDGPPVDVVFLRNVLIYFDEAIKLRVLDNIRQCMAPQGWLFLGGSEVLSPTVSGFTAIRSQIYRKVA